MSLLTEFGFDWGLILQRCRAYGAGEARGLQSASTRELVGCWKNSEPVRSRELKRRKRRAQQLNYGSGQKAR